MGFTIFAAYGLLSSSSLHSFRTIVGVGLSSYFLLVRAVGLNLSILVGEPIISGD